MIFHLTDETLSGGYRFRGLKIGPLQYVSQGFADHPRRYRERTIFVGAASVSTGAPGALEAGHADACTASRMRGRWLRRRYPAVLLAWDGGPGIRPIGGAR